MPVLANSKHEAVVQAYIADPAKVGWRAYKAVYPKSSRRAAETAFGRLLKDPEFAGRIADLNAVAAEGAVATARQVLEELTKLGLANMQDYFDSEGAPLPVSALSRDHAAALQEYVVETFMEGHGKDARPVRRVRIKLTDKRAALAHLADHHGLFKTERDPGEIANLRAKSDGEIFSELARQAAELGIDIGITFNGAGE